MTASELLKLAQKLDNHAIGYGDYAIAGQLREAAEVLELVAWAEEKKVDIEWADYKWWAGCIETGDTLIDTLRRAKEAVK